MIDRARELGLKVMVGCMTESTVGISAIAPAAAAVGLRRHGRCRAALARRRHRRRLDRGRCIYPAENGTGARLFR